MRSQSLCVSLALVVLGTAGSCAVTDGDREPTQESAVTESPAVSAFVLTVTGLESEDVSGGGADNFCDSTCNYAFLGGTTVTIGAVGSVADCLTFASWTGACAGQGRICTIVMNSDLTTTSLWQHIPGCRPQ